MTKINIFAVNIFLLAVCLLAALILITARTKSKGIFAELEKQEELTRNLEEQYKLMQLQKARLTNINRVKKKAAALGMILPDFTARRVIEVESNVNSR